MVSTLSYATTDSSNPFESSERNQDSKKQMKIQPFSL